MLTNIAKFTVRTYGEILKKFRYVADYNGRSANRELEVLMKKHIAEFEKEHGKITFD
ncbi:MAG: Arc family DNA-binding protein [Lachnospiraceae bacterium]|nr:Arc family DNA-binding protein [Lachnospiraceae bacterium]